MNTQDFTWEQGDDLVLSFVYKVGDTADTATPVDLTGWSLRMDIATTDSPPTRVWTFNSDDIADPDVDQVGPADNEAVLGADGSINITVPRSLTLPGGAIYDEMQLAKLAFQYDIFLRDTNDKQKKILKGIITIDPSVTLWV